MSELQLNDAGVIECEIALRDANCTNPATESHWAISRPHRGRWKVHSYASCHLCIEASKEHDQREAEREAKYGPVSLFLYLPIIQPIVGDENSLAMELFFDAAARLCRLGKGDENALTDLALLRAEQQRAYADNHREAA